MLRPRSAHLAILTCPGCGRGGLRVPDGRRGNVTCPKCRAEWFHPPTIELSEVEFRCAQSGARFVVQMSRRSPLHKFVIQGIKDAPLGPWKAAAAKPKPGLDNNIVQAQVHSAPQLPPTKSRGWLERLFDKAIELPNSRSRTTDHSAPIVHSTAGAMQHEATEYNWASFFCPYCDASGFVKCSGGHLACDGQFRYATDAAFINATAAAQALSRDQSRRSRLTSTPSASSPTCPGLLSKTAKAEMQQGSYLRQAERPASAPPRTECRRRLSYLLARLRRALVISVNGRTCHPILARGASVPEGSLTSASFRRSFASPVFSTISRCGWPPVRLGCGNG